MNTRKDCKMISKLLLDFIDKEIKKSKKIYEAVGDQEDDNDVIQRNINKALGRPESERGEGIPLPVGSKYNIDTTNIPEIIRKDAAGQNIINHSILKLTIEQNYFSYSVENENVLEPVPLLLWGAPGIGKSSGVKAGAIECARQIAASKGFTGDKFIIIDDIQKSEELNKSPEELKQNFYFLNWSITNRNIKENIILGKKEYAENEPGTKTPVYQHGLRVPASNLFIFFDVRVVGMSEQDILGMPVRVDKTIRTKEGDIQIPSINLEKLPFLDLCCREQDLHGIIMWDEINQATDIVQAALYQIILDRNVGDQHLAPGIGSFAAANSPLWQGGNLKPALASRFSTHYLYLSPVEWVTNHEKKLVPILKDFIKSNPAIAFYISEQVWDKYYVPLLKSRGLTPAEGIQGVEEYAKDPTQGRWPTPRDLTAVNQKFKELLNKQKQTGMSTNEVVQAAIHFARSKVGPVWADHFEDFYRKTTTVDWNVLVNNKKAAMELAKGLSTKEIVRQVLQSELFNVYNLSLSPHNKAEYEAKLKELMKAFVNVSSENIEFVMVPIWAVKEDVANQKITPVEKINAKIVEIVQKGIKTNSDPKWQQEASVMFKRIAEAMKESIPDESKNKSPTQFINQLKKEPEQTSTQTITPSASDVNEKYIRFNSIFEEVQAAFTQQKEDDTQTDIQDYTNKQIQGIKLIIERVHASVKNKPANINQGQKKQSDIVLDYIKQAILQDSILEQHQKQKLIKMIKVVPDAINALLVLKAFSSSDFIL